MQLVWAQRDDAGYFPHLMAPNVNHVCKVLCNGLICVPSAPNSYVNVLNVDIFGRAIILLTTGLIRESQSTVLCLAVSWDCAPWLVHRKWSDGLDHRPETPREQESRLQTIGLCAGNMIQLSVLHTFKNLFQCFSKYSPWAPELAFCDAYKNSQSHWVSLPTRTFITSMHAWLGADDLESPDSSPVSPAFSLSTSLEALFIQHLLLRNQINCSLISIPLALYADPQTTALFYRCLLWICWIMFYSSFPLGDYTISPFLHWEMCNWPCFPFPNALESNSQLKYHNFKGRHWLCIHVLFSPWTLPVLIYILLAPEY